MHSDTWHVMIYKWYTSTDNWASIFYQSPICFRTFEQKNKCGYLQNLHWFTSCILNDNSPVEGCSPAGWKTIQNGQRNWSKVQEPSEADPYVSVSNIPKKVYCREIQVVGSSSISGLLSPKCQFFLFCQELLMNNQDLKVVIAVVTCLLFVQAMVFFSCKYFCWGCGVGAKRHWKMLKRLEDQWSTRGCYHACHFVPLKGAFIPSPRAFKSVVKERVMWESWRFIIDFFVYIRHFTYNTFFLHTKFYHNNHS